MYSSSSSSSSIQQTTKQSNQEAISNEHPSLYYTFIYHKPTKANPHIPHSPRDSTTSPNPTTPLHPQNTQTQTRTMPATPKSFLPAFTGFIGTSPKKPSPSPFPPLYHTPFANANPQSSPSPTPSSSPRKKARPWTTPARGGSTSTRARGTCSAGGLRACSRGSSNTYQTDKSEGDEGEVRRFIRVYTFG